MSSEAEISKYGLWSMRCLKTVCLCGKIMNEGDDFQVPGNTALTLALNFDAEFLDESGEKAKEEKVEKLARELSAPIDWQAAPQDFPDAAPIKRR